MFYGPVFSELAPATTPLTGAEVLLMSQRQDGKPTAVNATVNAVGAYVLNLLPPSANSLPVSGGEMTGYLTLFDDPVSPRHAVTKRYVDNQAVGIDRVLRSGDVMTGYLTLSGAPTSDFHAANKQYVDLSIAAGPSFAYIDAAVATRAPLASPVLTGTPTAPTAVDGTNTTQLATTAFVNAALASASTAVVSVAGRTGAIVLTNADVSGSAPIASPTFTGTVTLPGAPTVPLHASTKQYVDDTIGSTLLRANNLSDLTDASAARSNLSLGDGATFNVGIIAGTLAAGDDSRIVNALQVGGGSMTGELAIAGTAGFWSDDATPGLANRVNDRLFVGKATDNTGAANQYTAVYNTTYLANTFVTYFDAQATFASYSPNGGIAGVFTTKSSEAANAGSWYASMATIGVASYAENDNPTVHRGTWAYYGHALKTTNGTTIVGEYDIANKGTLVAINSYNMGTTGLTAVHWLGCGGETAQLGGPVNPASCAIGIISTDPAGDAVARTGGIFNRGILFQATAISGTDGVTGYGTAIQMAKGHKIQWTYDSSANSGGEIRSAATGAGSIIEFVNNELNLSDTSSNVSYRFQTPFNPENGFIWTPTSSGTAPIFGTKSLTQTNVGLEIKGQGTGATSISTANGAQFQVLDNGAATTVNRAYAIGAITGLSPVIGARSSIDTNVSLDVKAQGTGAVNLWSGNGVQFQSLDNGTATTVNRAYAIGSVTGVAPILGARGTDTNVALELRSQGTGIVSVLTGNGAQFQVLDNGAFSTTNRAYAVGSVTGASPALGARSSIDANVSLDVKAQGTGAVNLWTGGGAQFQALDSGAGTTINRAYAIGAIAGANPTLGARGSDTDVSLDVKAQAAGTVNLWTGNGVQFQALDSGVGTTVNRAYAIGGATGVAPIIGSRGADTDVALSIKSQGVGIVSVQTGNGVQFQVLDNGTATTVNRAYAMGGITGVSAVVGARSTVDTNVALDVKSQGTGTISLWTGNGAQFQVMDNGAATTVNRAYAIGAIATGTPVIGARGTDTNVSLDIKSQGTGLVSVTTGNGTQFQVIDSATGTTVNRAYAVGAVTTASPAIGARSAVDTNVNLDVKSQGSGTISLTTGTGAQFQVLDYVSGTTVNRAYAIGAVTGVAPILGARGTDTNIPLQIKSQGTGTISLMTGNGVQFQAIDNGTATTVNRVYARGGVTAVAPILGVSGTDTNVSFSITSQGTGVINMFTGNGAQFQVLDNGTATTTNRAYGIGAVTGLNPVLGARGSDTNVSLDVKSQGTGTFNFINASGTIFQIVDTGGTAARNAVAKASTSTGSPTVYPSAGNLLLGLSSVTTTATAGMIQIPTVAGTPTGVPSNNSGNATIVYDTTNSKLWCYAGGAWKGVVFA